LRAGSGGLGEQALEQIGNRLASKCGHASKIRIIIRINNSRMPRLRKSTLRPRKLPVQRRSARMVDDILAAAIRVLEREGAQRFTTIRVAAQAGISVGSLYQYFPNKQAILYQLQVGEWQQTSAAIDAIVTDRSRSPEQRLRDTIRWFFHSECEEAPLR